MLDTIKHGIKKINKVLQDIFYNVPDGLMFIIKCSLITMFWILLVA